MIFHQKAQLFLYVNKPVNYMVEKWQVGHLKVPCEYNITDIYTQQNTLCVSSRPNKCVQCISSLMKYVQSCFFFNILNSVYIFGPVCILGLITFHLYCASQLMFSLKALQLSINQRGGSKGWRSYTTWQDNLFCHTTWGEKRDGGEESKCWFLKVSDRASAWMWQHDNVFALETSPWYSSEREMCSGIMWLNSASTHSSI